MQDEKSRVPKKLKGLVLSGGGARGAFQVGAWQAIREKLLGWDEGPDVISGTSAGALNGAFLAAGLSPEEMLQFWIEMSENPPVIANESFFRSLIRALETLIMSEPWRPGKARKRDWSILKQIVSKHRWYSTSGLLSMLLEFFLTARFDLLSALMEQIRTTYLFDTRPLRDRLRRIFGGMELRQTRTRLAINTVDVRTGKVVRIVNHPPQKSLGASAQHYRVEPSIPIDILVASASIPLLFNPVLSKGQALWDGGILVNTPLAPAVTLGATEILPVLVTLRSSGNRDPLATFGGAVERLVDAFLENAYNTDRKLLLERNTLASHLPDLQLTKVQLYRAIRPYPGQLFNAGSYLYFEREALLAMYRSGQIAAQHWLAAGPLWDSRDLDD